MANKISKKQYDSIKNESYTLLIFNNGQRIMSYGNVSLLEAVEHQARYTTRSTVVSLIVHQSHVDNRKKDIICISRDISCFQDLFDLGADRLKPREEN